jgi:ribA/ribD-fused uncharacterized protein
MQYSLNWLQNQVSSDNNLDYLFFWGHTPKEKGKIDKYCFSQWFPSPFVVEGVTYSTAEHWMMVKKALLFGDQEQYEKILSSDSPAKAKQCGRAVKNFDPQTWETNAFAFVVEGNQHKFSQHAAMQDFLLSTGDSVIVEASPFDKIWGIGTRAHEKDPFQWKGKNLLGFALMQVRDQLKQQK